MVRAQQQKLVLQKIDTVLPLPYTKLLQMQHSVANVTNDKFKLRLTDSSLFHKISCKAASCLPATISVTEESKQKRVWDSSNRKLLVYSKILKVFALTLLLAL